ncbi:MAG TPA: marine proteobacterial sortase target protein [Gammaproteobacteria bacterium]|nr:marine proteobacterial sortase target protein [Gammaproteobacteria bacterium]
MCSDEEAGNSQRDWRATCRRWLALFVLLLPGVVWFPADAAADSRSPSAAGLWLRSSADAEPVAALGVDTRFRVRVTGNTARVEVTQTFSNPFDEWLEGLYVFPLAAAAAVDQMEMQLGERVIRGEIRPRAAARAAYEAARTTGRRASLVDQERPNLFTTSVANIPPRGEVTVRIAYLEVIPWRDERYTLKLPLAITPRYTPGVVIDPGGEVPWLEAAIANGWLGSSATPERVTASSQRAHIDIELSPGFALDSLHSLHHAVSIDEDAGTGRQRIRAAAAAAERDFELSWTPVLAPDTQAVVYAEQFAGETHALLMLTPPEVGAGATPPREVIFIIDTSGSMGGPPIQQARAALELGVARLKPQDHFNVIRFSNDASALFDRSRPADPAARRAARRFIASLEASGGTEMRPALELAFSTTARPGALRQVVFITDGSVANEADIIRLIERRRGDARLFTVGIGAAPNAWFMQEAAAAGRGSHTFIARAELVGGRMAELFRKLERPALIGLELHWPGANRPDLATPLPRDLYAGDPLVVVARLDHGPPSGLVTLAGRDAHGDWVHQVPIIALQGEAGIARLWARERITELSRRKRLAGSDAPSADLDAQILELALGYGLVSDLTSLVAVDATPVRPAGAPGRLAQVPTAAPAGGAWAHAGFPATATAAPLLTRLGALAFAVAGLAFLGGRVRRRRA